MNLTHSAFIPAALQDAWGNFFLVQAHNLLIWLDIYDEKFNHL